MEKKQCVFEMNMKLRNALLKYRAMSEITQEKLAEMLQITPRACSAIENGAYVFSLFTAMSLFAIIPSKERGQLFSDICNMILPSYEE